MSPAAWLASPIAMKVLFGGVLIVIIATMAVIDSRKMILPNQLSLVLAAAGVAQSIVLGHPGPLDAVLGAVLAFLLLWSVAGMFRRYRGIEGLGFGDVKFSAAAGLWIGWAAVAPMLLIASCSALLFVLLQAWKQHGFDATSRLPFGPFLGLGAVTCWVAAALPPSLG